MSTFEYVVARYIPDIVKDEPKNVGVIVVDKQSKQYFGKFIGDDCLRELQQQNPNVNVLALKKILEIYQGKNELPTEDYLNNLVKDSSHSLQFRNVCTQIASTPELALEKLFEQYISLKPQMAAA